MINKENYHFLYRLSKKVTPFLKQKNRFTETLNRNNKSEEANEILKNIILKNEPFMCARFGSTESRAILNFQLKKKQITDFHASLKHIRGKMNIYWKEHPKFLTNLTELSGFFPKDENLLENFVNLYTSDIKNLDLLGIWNEYEEFLKVPEDTKLCKIRELEPWFYNEPWTAALEGKKVLVIHPFEETIKKTISKERKTL